jgi:uncharacterized protein (TIGR02246 family)
MVMGGGAMVFSRRMVLTCLFLSLAACGATGESRDDGTLRRGDVAEATAAWVAAFNSRDPSRITALYDAAAVFWGTTSPTIRTNPAAVAEYFKDAPKRPDARVSLDDQHVRVFGDLAINSGAYTFTDGKGGSNAARFTFVYRYRNGRWIIIDHHSSRVPAP